MTATPVPFVVGSSLPRAPRIGWAYAVAGAATVALLVAVANPTFGVVVRGWPWDLPSPGRWSRESAVVFALAAGSLALLAAALLPPGTVRASLATLACAVPLAALRAGSRDSFLSVSTYVPPVLAGVLGGSLYGSLGARGRGAGRAVVATCAFALTAVLLYPLDAPEGEARAYASPLVVIVNDLREVASTAGAEGVGRYLLGPPAFLALGYGLLVVAGLLAAATRVRVLAWAGIVVAWLVSLWPLAHPYVSVFLESAAGDNPEGLSPATLRLRSAGDALLVYGLPAALGAFAATADFVRRVLPPALPIPLPASAAPAPAPVGPPNGREDR